MDPMAPKDRAYLSRRLRERFAAHHDQKEVADRLRQKALLDVVGAIPPGRIKVPDNDGASVEEIAAKLHKRAPG